MQPEHPGGFPLKVLGMAEGRDCHLGGKLLPTRREECTMSTISTKPQPMKTQESGALQRLRKFPSPERSHWRGTQSWDSGLWQVQRNLSLSDLLLAGVRAWTS